jgi:hypothetical protein
MTGGERIADEAFAPMSNEPVLLATPYAAGS